MSSFAEIVPLLLIAAVFYLFLIRPKLKKDKERATKGQNTDRQINVAELVELKNSIEAEKFASVLSSKLQDKNINSQYLEVEMKSANTIIGKIGPSLIELSLGKIENGFKVNGKITTNKQILLLIIITLACMICTGFIATFLFGAISGNSSNSEIPFIIGILIGAGFAQVWLMLRNRHSRKVEDIIKTSLNETKIELI